MLRKLSIDYVIFSSKEFWEKSQWCVCGFFFHKSSASARELSLLNGCLLRSDAAEGIESFRCVWGTACLYCQVEEFCAVKMETTHFPETSIIPSKVYGIKYQNAVFSYSRRLVNLSLGYLRWVLKVLLQNCEKRLLASCLSVLRPHGTNRLPLDGIELSLIFEFFFFSNLSRKLLFFLNLTRITGTLHQYIYTFMNVV